MSTRNVKKPYTIEICCDCGICHVSHNIIVQFASEKLHDKYEDMSFDRLIDEFSVAMRKSTGKTDCFLDDVPEPVQEITDSSIVPHLIVENI